MANFRFPIAKGEKDLSSLTTSFARFVRSSVLCLRRVALQYIFCRLPQNRQMTTNGFHTFKVNIALGRAIPSTVSDSFFISLTAPDYAQVSPEILRSAASNADTLEFRVDLLESLEPENVIHQVPKASKSQNSFKTPSTCCEVLFDFV